MAAAKAAAAASCGELAACGIGESGSGEAK